MKEYKVEMVRCFSTYENLRTWRDAHSPNSGKVKTFPDRKKAEAYLKRIQKLWAEWCLDYRLIEEEAPTDFRIVSRTVTEWEEVF